MDEARLRALVETHGGPEALIDALLEWSRETLVGATWHEPSALSPDTAAAIGAGGRYEDRGLIGLGGMGEVRRVRDTLLSRDLAMKIIRPELADLPGVRGRFIGEATVTAQLQHPGIVPIHEVGRLPDGRWYFTMREVKGRTLRDVIREVHDASNAAGAWVTSANGWTLWGLVDAFHKICAAVASAHAAGVVHRDLKPDNAMVGAFGEVLVVDWGIARRVDSPEPALSGAISGTPAYMPPEQARGDGSPHGPRSDVYSLGAILYCALTRHAPYSGRPESVIEQVVGGAPLPPSARTHLPVPPALEAICLTAMSPDPADRYADAGAVATEIGQWLQGAKNRERALAIVARADATGPRVAEARARAAERLGEARTAAAAFSAWDEDERKRPAWALEDEATSLTAEADRLEGEQVQLLDAALETSPDLPEAHAALADFWHAQHARAEGLGLLAEARRAEQHLRAHDRGKHAAWLRGNAQVDLDTDPPARAELFRFVERDRRLQPERVGDLGTTPLRGISLARGSWLIVLTAPGFLPLSLPIHLERLEHWTERPIRLLRPDALGPDDCLVPEGWFWAGDEVAPNALRRQRIWLDRFAIRRFPVTNRQYIAFLDDLVARGDTASADRFGPRERGATLEVPGPMLYRRDAAGRHHIQPDHDGDVWHLDWPAMMIDLACANAFAAWEAERTGLPWRLPWAVEWEKAARGVDGRRWPWGDHLDLGWANVRGSGPGRMLPAVVDSFPRDVSVYGVRGLIGNIRDWLCDSFDFATRSHRMPGSPHETSDMRAMRGSFWFAIPVPPAYNQHTSIRSRATDLGLRLVRSL
jgi:serine/threonine-protein kinase